jgi:hypothetical protein
VDVSPGLISNVTEAVMDEVKIWQCNRVTVQVVVKSAHKKVRKIFASDLDLC